MDWVVACWCGDSGVEIVFDEEIVEVVLWCEVKKVDVYVSDDGDFGVGVCDL